MKYLWQSKEIPLFINSHIHTFFFAAAADLCAASAIEIIMCGTFGSTTAAGSGAFLNYFRISCFGNNPQARFGAFITKPDASLHTRNIFA
jgi:hypothetical protein